MRLNHDKLERARDYFGEIQLRDCPRFREQAEKALTLLLAMPPFSYGSVAEFQKIVVAEYWRRLDGLDLALERHERSREFIWFRNWYVKLATQASDIERALRWLVEAGYVVLTPTVKERAGERAKAIRKGA